MQRKLQAFIENQMKKGGRWVPARLQAGLALLEKLRDKPSLEVADHLASRGSSGLESHETFGKNAHDRLGLEPINKNHGRRSSNLQDWGQSLLDILGAEGFAAALPDHQAKIVDDAQLILALPLRSILEQEPLEVRVRGRSAESVIADLLDQADNKGKSGDVAQYLVGAKLRHRFNVDIPALPANKGDRKSRADKEARAGDFEIADAVIEVAVGLPDEKHLAQVAEAIEESDREVWLLTRADRVEVWKVELKKYLGIETRRVVVTSVEVFVGQNISELGKFTSKGKEENLNALFEIYNTHWIATVGTPGIRVVIK